jgi:hypothetical protein
MRYLNSTFPIRYDRNTSSFGTHQTGGQMQSGSGQKADQTVHLSIHRLPILLRRNPNLLLEHSGEMLWILEAQAIGDLAER